MPIPLVTHPYWVEILDVRESINSIRIKGHHYWGTDKGSGSFLPFDGRKFSMRRISDGALRVTMMWDNAQIPEFLKEYLPDNYEFIS